jgi:hypothetical protein
VRNNIARNILSSSQQLEQLNMAGGRPIGSQKERRFKAALVRLVDADPKRLDEFAEKLWATALEGDVSAMREVADRLDGKVPQAVVGDDEHGPIEHVIRWADDAAPQNYDASQQSAPIGGHNADKPKT